MKFGLEPIANHGPYRRVGINDPAPADANVVQEKRSAAETEEHFRIWALVKGAAEGTNITAREYEAPDEDCA